MNYFSNRSIFISILAIIFAGCASTSKLDPEPQKISNIDSENETISQNSTEQINSLDSEQLQKLKAQIDVELTKRNVENESKQTDSQQVNEKSNTSNAVVIGLAETPSPNKEMIMSLAKLGVFDQLYWEIDLLKPITRGQFLALLYYGNNTIRKSDDRIRLAPSHNPDFSDVNSSHPAYKYIQAFDNAGFSVGYTDKTFKPDRPITREEIIGIKLAIDEGTPKSVRLTSNPWKFSDFEQVDPKFVPYLYRDHVIGYSNISRAFGNLKSFKPKQFVVGYEAAGMVSGFKQDNAEKAIEKLEKN